MNPKSEIAIKGPEDSKSDFGFETLFDGTRNSFKQWHQVEPAVVSLEKATMVTTADTEFGVAFYSQATFGDFILQLEFSLSDPWVDNSGIFVRFRDPRLPPSRAILAEDNFHDIKRNRAWIPAYSGFEIQIDDQARGNDKYCEPDGLDKHRTGAIYGVPTGQHGETRMQDYSRPEKLKANEWNLYEIEVLRQTYVARLNGQTTTRFVNKKHDRAIHPDVDPTYGYIGVQSYPNSRVAFRNIRVKQLNRAQAS